jgi:histidinol phosphatase-like PHP family hydrolase
MYKQLAPDDEWFEVKTEVRGKRVRVWLDGTEVVDYREPDSLPESWGETFQTLGSGTFALQCHDPESKVFYRNLRVRALPDDADDTGPAPVADERFVQTLELAKANFPLVDLHVHIKGGVELDRALEISRASGMAFGLAVNCGKGFPVETDEGALEFLKKMEGQPVFIGMQAEGREWMDMFSAEVRAQFDYVFTDSMTFTDHRGERTRLWMPDEVEVGDEQAFMDMLVEKTVGILENEPIDIYVNPTFLPEVIAGDYDRLWTEKRMKAVIDAAVANGIAIEINARYKLPSEAFLRLAKEAGAKFTFGTNNTGADDLGDWSYPLDMQRALELDWEDMFVPGHAPSQAQRDLSAEATAD